MKRAIAKTQFGDFRCLHYSYVDVPAGAATFQPLLIGGLPRELQGVVPIDIEFSWHQITPKLKEMVAGSGTITVKVMRPSSFQR